jgi:hypothetical protein
LLILAALTPGCRCVEYVHVPCDASEATDATRPDAPRLDAAVPDAALLDAAVADAAPPAAQPLCTGTGDTADHLEPLGGEGGNPQMTADAFGAAAAIAATAGGTLVLFGADGARRAADLALPAAPVAIVFDGLDYRIVEETGPSVQVRTLSPAGVLGTPIPIGLGRAIPGGLAVHASGDVAVLWVATADASLRATVVPAAGAPIETVLDPRTSFTNVQLVGGVVATQSATSRFVAAFERVDPTGTTIFARPLDPAGPAQQVSTGGIADRTRAGIVPTAVVDTSLVTFKTGNDVHVAMVDAAGTPVLTDRTVVTAPAGSSLTRVAGHGGPGAGFEILVDLEVASDRALFLHGFDATGTETSSRRIATICSSAYSEANLSFVRNSSVRYVTWFDLSLPDNLTASF